MNGSIFTHCSHDVNNYSHIMLFMEVLRAMAGGRSLIETFAWKCVKEYHFLLFVLVRNKKLSSYTPMSSLQVSPTGQISKLILSQLFSDLETCSIYVYSNNCNMHMANTSSCVLHLHMAGCWEWTHHHAMPSYICCCITYEGTFRL